MAWHVVVPEYMYALNNLWLNEIVMSTQILLIQGIDATYYFYRIMCAVDATSILGAVGIIRHIDRPGITWTDQNDLVC